LIILLP